MPKAQWVKFDPNPKSGNKGLILEKVDILVVSELIQVI